MLDPLNAISLASSIAQLIEFSAKLLKEASDIRSDGSSVNVRYLKGLTIDLVSLEEALQKRARLDGLNRDDSLIHEEETLDALAGDCAKVGDELVAILERLTFEHQSGKWKSLRAALLTLCKKERIDVLANQLEGYRQELTLRLLTLLNAKNDLYSSKIADRLDTLNRDSKDIIEIVSISQSILKHAFEPQPQTEKYRQARNIEHPEDGDDDAQSGKDLQFKSRASKGQRNVIAKHRYDETIAAILTSRDGTMRTVSLGQPTKFGASWSRGRLIQTSTTFQEGPPEEYHDFSSKEPSLRVDDYSDIPVAILNCLYFRQITDRMEDVAQSSRGNVWMGLRKLCHRRR